MPRRLVIHIGYYKTGSTALQDQLSHLRPTLERHGVLYPAAARPLRRNPSHSALAFQELYRVGVPLPYWYANGPEFGDFEAGTAVPAREALAIEIAASDAETIIISSEELVRFGSDRGGVPAAQTKDMLRSLGIEHVTIVCYVRRPDRYVESWYNQLVKLGVPTVRLSVSMVRPAGSGHRFYGTVHTDFDRMIEYWAHEVGCDELIVRNYDCLHNETIFDDFTVVVGLPSVSGVKMPELRQNLRLDNNFIEYMRVWSLFRPHEASAPLRRLLVQMADSPHLPRRSDVYVLDEPARQRLHAYVTPMNERLGKLAGMQNGFFADLDDMLTVPAGARSDVDAFRFWAPYINMAVRAAGPRVIQPVSSNSVTRSTSRIPSHVSV